MGRLDEDDRAKWFMTRDDPPPPTTGFVRWNVGKDDREETSLDDLLSM